MTPRDVLRHLRVQARDPDGMLLVERSCAKCQAPDELVKHAAFCPVPAFDALLAVARAYRWESEEPAHVAMARLDQDFPDWMEWGR